MSLDTILWLTGLAAELGVVALCVRARLFRSNPVFSSYVAWSLFVDIFFYFLHRAPSLSATSYFRIYIVQMIVDALFQFTVLVELGWGVLQPIRQSLPKYSILILGVLIAIAGAVIWPIASWSELPRNFGPLTRFFVHLQQTIAILRVVVFVALAGFSQLLSIGWRNRELQIAKGLGFYSMCSLAVSLIHSHQSVGQRYVQLDLLAAASYTCSLVYWIVSFAQKEEERQEFTPQMRSFLLTVTGAAHGTRVALANSGTTRPGKPREP